MKYCHYCHEPEVILMLDCPTCGRAYTSRTSRETNHKKNTAINFNPKIVRELHECGLNSSSIFRSYAIGRYYEERAAERMTTEEFKVAVTIIKDLFFWTF